MFIYSIPLWVLVLLLPFIILVRRNLETGKANERLPPGPPKLPIIGNLHQLRGSPWRYLCQISRKYGPVVHLKLCSKPAVVISSAEAAEEVLKINDLHSCSRPPLAGSGKLSYNFLDISFSPYGDYWRQIRKLCVVELFSSKRVQSFRFIREEEVASVINSIDQSSSFETPVVDLTEKLITLVANITFRVAFSTTFEAADFAKDRFIRLVHDAETLLGSFSGNDYFPFAGSLIDRITGYEAMSERIFQEMDSFFEQVIDEHLQDGGTVNRDHRDIVDVLLRIEREPEIGSIQLTRDHIKAVLMDIFLAGVSTGSDTLVWAMSELARNPSVMKKVQEEIRTLIGKKGTVTEGDIDELHYLKLVIKETLRLHPPAPLLLPRQAMSKFRIKNYDIHPGTLIQINVWAIGRDPNYWKNPEEFIPERFQDSSVDFKGQNFEFLPFGAGRRICPGQYMGTILVELALASLLYYFDWKLPEDAEDINMEENDGPSLAASKKEALKLVPVKYLKKY